MPGQPARPSRERDLKTSMVMLMMMMMVIRRRSIDMLLFFRSVPGPGPNPVVPVNHMIARPLMERDFSEICTILEDVFSFCLFAFDKNPIN